MNFYLVFQAISPPLQYLWDTFHKMSRAITQTRTHTHTTGSLDSLVIYEGIFIDGLYDQLEWYLGGQSVSVLDHWLSVGSIPAVHCKETEEQEKRCMNKTPGCFSQFPDRSSLNTLQRTVCVFWMSGLLCCTIAHSAGMNYSGCG